MLYNRQQLRAKVNGLRACKIAQQHPTADLPVSRSPPPIDFAFEFFKTFFFSVGVSQAELFEAVRRRRGRSRSEDEEEDLGLPSSPYGVSPSTTADEHNNLVSALLLV
jgi:hypothetical protein